MRTRSTLLIAAVAVAAALFFFLVEEPRHERETRQAASTQRLTSTPAEDVHTVSIERPDIVITAVREAEHWKVTSPVRDEADDPAFNTLVLATCRAEVERRFGVEESRLAEYGLAPPSAVVRLGGKNGESLLEIRVGDLTPSGGVCYALSGKAPEVLLLPSGVRRYALRPFFEFRNKRILDTEVSDVERIEIASRERSMTWTARGSGGWFSVQNGDTVRGDAREVESVVRRLRGLRARDIPIGEPASTQARFTHRAGTIRLWTRADSAGISLTFSDPRSDSCYVQQSGSLRVALVDTAALAVFRKTLDDFRDRRILTYPKDSLARIVWETRGQTFAILKTEDRWSHANSRFGKMDEGAVRRLLSAIETLEFTKAFEDRFVEMTGYGFDAPALRLTLFDTDGRVIDEAVFGSLTPDGAARYVSSRSSRLLAGMDPAFVARLEDDLADLGGP